MTRTNDEKKTRTRTNHEQKIKDKNKTRARNKDKNKQKQRQGQPTTKICKGRQPLEQQGRTATGETTDKDKPRAKSLKV